jgi:hypothetical protein
MALIDKGECMWFAAASNGLCDSSAGRIWSVAHDEDAPAPPSWPVSRNNSSRNVFETTGKENKLRAGL